MRFISILASASVKLATRVPGANRVVCPNTISAPETAPIAAATVAGAPAATASVEPVAGDAAAESRAATA